MSRSIRNMAAAGVLAATVVGGMPLAAASSTVPAQEGVYGEPMTSSGLTLGQEASLLGGLITWRESMVGTMEWRNCTTLDTSSQVTCHALDAVAPVLMFIITGGNSSVAGETAKIAFDPNHEFRK